MAYHSPVFRYLAARLWWLVFFIPLAAYAPAVWSEYGWRDDYSMIREAAEAPGTVWRFAMAQGRPVYGWLLEGSLYFVHGVPTLPLLRTFSILAIGGVALLLAWSLRRYRHWSPAEAAAAGALFVVLPSAQIVAGWAIAWPHAFAALSGLGSYMLAEEAWRSAGGKRFGFAAGALLLFVAGALCYPCNVLVYVVPLVPVWLRCEVPEQRRRRNLWFAAHLGFLAVALLAAFVALQATFTLTGVTAADRIAFEIAPGDKLAWFALKPLPQALALFVLHDTWGRTDLWFAIAGLASVGAIVLAIGRSAEWRVGRFLLKLTGFVVLCFAAYAVSLVASERWPTYRTQWALSGVILLGVWSGVRSLHPADDPFGEFVRTRRGSVAFLVAALAGLACWNTRSLIADPQREEWRRFVACAATLDPNAAPSVFVVSPQPAETRSPIRHLDEFGSYSADADWPAKEMMIQAFRVTHPKTPEPFDRVAWHSGYTPPARPEKFDRVIDLRPRS